MLAENVKIRDTWEMNDLIEGLRKTMRNLHQDSWSVGRGLKLGSPKHEARVLTIRPWRLVKCILQIMLWQCALWKQHQWYWWWLRIPTLTWVSLNIKVATAINMVSFPCYWRHCMQQLYPVSELKQNTSHQCKRCTSHVINLATTTMIYTQKN
jgi:hypothetical protein